MARSSLQSLLHSPWIALVGPEIEENLSLRYLSSSLQATGFTVEILPFHTEAHFAQTLNTILAAPPLLVGLSLAFQWRAQDFLALTVALREQGYSGHITAGGHFATFAAREILTDFPELSSVIRQEAEETIVKLAQALQNGLPWTEIPGLAFPKPDGSIQLTAHPALPDLAKLPWPDRRGLPASCFAHGIAPLVASRGCYANCSFCCIAAWHEQSLPGKRYRVRTVEAVADEMIALQRDRGIDIFVFHDDNFFVPGHKANKERFSALADALEKRGIGRFATVVKARPTDVDEEVFAVLKHRLHCIRVYIGVESDADQGLKTLRRWAASRQNHASIKLVRELELYTCFNLLLFDPDTTLDSLKTNIEFMRFAHEFPFNFGRVELYAGTPLLARMQSEGRCQGDWLQWDYKLGNPGVEQVFELAMDCFHPRNFGNNAVANRIMGTRFDIEVVRHFHPDLYRTEWLQEGNRLSTRLALDSAEGLAEIVGWVEAGLKGFELMEAKALLKARLRSVEAEVTFGMKALATELLSVIQQGHPLTEIGDQVATPLQQPQFS